jgi:hypothetical protein
MGPPSSRSTPTTAQDSQNQPNPNSPNLISFVIQRRILKFPQNIFVHLVTLFPVSLRLLPFFERSSKPQNLNPQFKFDSKPLHFSSFSWSLNNRTAHWSYFIRHPFFCNLYSNIFSHSIILLVVTLLSLLLNVQRILSYKFPNTIVNLLTPLTLLI